MKIINYFLLVLLLIINCGKKVEPPKPTPTPTNTPVPKLEKIIYTFNGHLYWINSDGTARQELFADSKSKWFPSASPDGWYIAYWVNSGNEYNLWVGDLKSNRTNQITYDKAPIDADVNNFNIGNSPSWDKEVKFIIYSRFNDIWKIDIDGYNQLALTESHNCFAPSLSYDNKIVFSKIENDSTYNIYLQTLFDKQDIKITNYINKKAGSCCISKDGQKILYTVIEEGNVNIFLYDLNTKSEKQLTYDGKSFSPSFAFDDRKILFASTVTDKFQPEIWMMNLDGTERVKITTSGGVCPSFLSRILAEPLPTSTPVIEKPVKKEETLDKMFELEEKPETQPTLPYDLTPPFYETPAPQITEIAKPSYEELKVSVIRKDNTLIFYPVIHFDSAYANIKSEFYPVLDDMAKIIKKFKKSPIRIEGHTDDDPIHTKQFPSNLELSIARAKEVRKYLNQKYGIDLKRITVKGYAETKPIVPNDSEENKYKNRRAEIIIVLDKSELNIKIEQPTPTPTDTPTVEPTSTPTPTPTPKLNFFQKILKSGNKPKKTKTW